MVSEALLVALLSTQIGLILLAWWWLKREIEDTIDDLNLTLGQAMKNAMKSLVEELPIGDIEPPSAIQQLAIEWIHSKMGGSSNQAQVMVAQDEQGRFMSEKN
jgi:hypothetical protein|tara:strand:+ start:259 stop:567 length:309 start_codon:yes stop_codon:yes gene_type:complete